jgi:hypothetical protein
LGTIGLIGAVILTVLGVLYAYEVQGVVIVDRQAARIVFARIEKPPPYVTIDVVVAMSSALRVLLVETKKVAPRVIVNSLVLVHLQVARELPVKTAIFEQLNKLRELAIFALQSVAESNETISFVPSSLNCALVITGALGATCMLRMANVTFKGV